MEEAQPLTVHHKQDLKVQLGSRLGSSEFVPLETDSIWFHIFVSSVSADPSSSDQTEPAQPEQTDPNPHVDFGPSRSLNQ